MLKKPAKISRRKFVTLVGGGLGSGLLLAACGDTPSTATAIPTASSTATAIPATTSAVATTSAAAATSAAATTSAATSSTALKKIKLAMPSIPLLIYSDSYIAKEGKFWEKEGLEIELVTGQGNAGAFQMLVNKEVFAAYGTCIATLVARTVQDLPIRSVYPIHRELIFVLVTKNDGKIVQPQDLKGKSIGVTTRNGATEQLLTLLMSKYGFQASDWTPVEVSSDLNKAYGFLERGEVAAYVATNHAGLELGFNQKPVDVLSMADFLTAPSGDITVQQDTIKNDAETVTRFLRGLHNARKWAQDPANLEKVLDYAQVYVPNELKSRDLAKLKIQSDIRLWSGKRNNLKMGQIDKAGWSSLQDQMFTSTFIKRKVDLAELIDTSFMEKIEP